MNAYIVVEGAVSEMKVYDSWITYVNPTIRRIGRIDEFAGDNFYLLSGRGYPQYFEMIENAIEDIDAYPNIDRLIVAADSEDMTFGEKYGELEEFIEEKKAGKRAFSYKIIVQHFCFEVWALGNKKIVQRNPTNDELKKMLTHYDVRTLDPEDLAPPPGFLLNRSQYAEKFLRKLLQEKYRGLTYSKSNPDVVVADHYFNQVHNRYTADEHIQSFSTFLDAFVL